jgi:hypothetical protein
VSWRLTAAQFGTLRDDEEALERRGDHPGGKAASPFAKRLTGRPSPGEEHGDPELADAKRTGPSGQGQRTVAEIHASRPGPEPGRLAAGSCRSGLEIRIGNSARLRALVPPGQKRAGVFRKLVTRVWA